MVGDAGGFGGHDHLAGDDGRVGFRDFPFFKLAGDYGGDLIVEAESHLGYY